MTLDQLINAYKAVHDGIAPDEATQARLQYFVNLSQNQPADAAAMSYIVNSADNSAALAVLSYQFFTGKAPTKAGLDYLVNSPVNPTDLNDRYYSSFNLENRYINFAANLGIQGEGSAAFASKYGALSFADYVAAIYQTIVGSAYATAAGIDPAKAIADIVARKDAILATATSSGMITPNMTAAQADIALKAATAGYLLGEAIKADVGVYASAANNFMVAVATGQATYGADITTAYAKPAGQMGGGGGQAIPPSFNFPEPVVTQPGQPNQPTAPTSHAFPLTAGADTFTGEGLADTFTGTIGTGATFSTADVLNGAGGADVLSLSGDAATLTLDPSKLTSIETLRVTASAALNLDLANAGFSEVTNNGSSQAITFTNAAPTSTLSINNTTFGTTFVTPNTGLGGTDSITLKLDTVTGAAPVTIKASSATSNEYETLNIASNGAATNSITLATDTVQTSLATINISGSAKLVLNFAGGGDQTAATATTIDAHALTGGLDVKLGPQGGNFVSVANVTLGGGADTVRFVGNTAAGTGAATDLTTFAKVDGFAVASDKLAFSASDADFSLKINGGTGAAALGLSKGVTLQGLAANDAMVVQTLAKDASAPGPTTDVSLIKLTTGVAFNTDIKTTFADAIGTGFILHLASNGNYLVSAYDTTHNSMIVAVVNVGGNFTNDDNLDAADFLNADIAVVGVVGMTASDYAAFGAGNLGLAF